MQATWPELCTAEPAHSAHSRRPHTRHPRAPGSASIGRLQSTHRSVFGLGGSAGGWATNGFRGRAIASHSARASATSTGRRSDVGADSLGRDLGVRREEGGDTRTGGVDRGEDTGSGGAVDRLAEAGRSARPGGPSHQGGRSVRGLEAGGEAPTDASGRRAGGIESRGRGATAGAGTDSRARAAGTSLWSSPASARKSENTPAPRTTDPAATTSSQIARCPGTEDSSSDRTIP